MKLGERRRGVTSRIKDIYIGKQKTREQHVRVRTNELTQRRANTDNLVAKLKNDMGGTMPTMDDFLQLRNKIAVCAEFTVGTFCPILVGKHKFDCNVVTKPVSSCVAISDEAFFLLTLENNVGV